MGGYREQWGLGHKIWNQTQNSGIRPSRERSRLWCLLKRGKGLEGRRTPETDLTLCHQVLEEGDKFESSFLRLDGCCFLALQKVGHTLVADVWNDLRLPAVGFAFQEEKESCFRSSASPHHSVSEQLSHHRIQFTMGWKKATITEDEMGMICA